MTQAVGGFNVNEMFAKISEAIETKGSELQDAMSKIDGSQMSDSDMLKMQFLVNSYNTMLEIASSVTKSLVDEAKQIAQRAN